MKKINKKHLTDTTLLKYIGKPFLNFDFKHPYMTFLGYDSSGWSNIWVKYMGEIRFIHLDDVEIAL